MFGILGGYGGKLKKLISVVVFAEVVNGGGTIDWFESLVFEFSLSCGLLKIEGGSGGSLDELTFEFELEPILAYGSTLFTLGELGDERLVFTEFG